MAIRVERSISDEGDGQENRIAASSAKCKGNKAGWSFYQGQLFHRSSASKKIFGHVDYRIFWEIEYWMRCRHPGKSLTWRRQKYYTRVGARGYVLQGTYLDRRGKPRTIRLIKAADVPIKRHVKIKAAANPYDPAWEPYFEERLAHQMKESHHGYERMVKLWFNQEGKCPQCGEKITRETGWNLHHRIRLVDGGDDSLANLVLMHPICHQQLHAQTEKRTAKVAKPRPP
jgi:RNA-directed DNA polymerase